MVSLHSLLFLVPTIVVGMSVEVDLASSTTVSPYFLGAGWEMYSFLQYYYHGNLTSPVWINIASHLAPGVVRVGGITADWVKYVTTPVAGRHRVESSITDPPYWPTTEANLTVNGAGSMFQELLNFFNSAKLHFVFDLNELHGRNCHTGANNATCVGAWDVSNLIEFLRFVRDNNWYDGGQQSQLLGFELGNELVSHLSPASNIVDIHTLRALVNDIWSDSPFGVPLIVGPSTDTCRDSAGTFDIMQAVSNALDAFTFHSYPGQDGSAILHQLNNVTWLRTNILMDDLHANASGCIDYWQTNIDGKTNMGLWVTESNVGYATDPVVSYKSFLNGNWYLSALGQYATTGVSVFARWAFAEETPFALTYYNSTRQGWDVAADYFLAVLHKRVAGERVLKLTSVPYDSPALVYGYCSRGFNNGSITLVAVNPSDSAVPVTLLPSSIAVSPRLEYVITAPGGNYNTTTPSLNGGPGMRIGLDGSLPSMDPVYISNSPLMLQPNSQSFLVLINANMDLCV
jgi:Glycosyl hydrolase family 79, N-terminal domain